MIDILLQQILDVLNDNLTTINGLIASINTKIGGGT